MHGGAQRLLSGTVEQFQQRVDTCDAIRNTERPHQDLPGRVTPQQVRTRPRQPTCHDPFRSAQHQPSATSASPPSATTARSSPA